MQLSHSQSVGLCRADAEIVGNKGSKRSRKSKAL